MNYDACLQALHWVSSLRGWPAGMQDRMSALGLWVMPSVISACCQHRFMANGSRNRVLTSFVAQEIRPTLNAWTRAALRAKPATTRSLPQLTWKPAARPAVSAVGNHQWEYQWVF